MSSTDNEKLRLLREKDIAKRQSRSWLFSIIASFVTL